MFRLTHYRQGLHLGLDLHVFETTPDLRPKRDIAVVY